VIAEGVETKAQVERLRGLGCRLAQGNYLSAPADAEAITARLERGIDAATTSAAPMARPLAD